MSGRRGAATLNVWSTRCQCFGDGDADKKTAELECPGQTRLEMSEAEMEAENITVRVASTGQYILKPQPTNRSFGIIS